MTAITNCKVLVSRFFFLQVRAANQEQQIQMFQTLLQDEVAEVRVVAINAVTMILSRFWILLSAADLQV